MDRSLRGSSYRSGRGRNEPRSLVARIKEGLRKTIAFLFGHVGICGLVVGYIIMGAFAFMAIEKETSHRTEEAMKRREETVQHLWRITYQLNVLYRDNWTEAVNEEVLKFQQKVVEAVGDGGYDGIRSQKMDTNSSKGAASVIGATAFSNEINQGPAKDNQWTFSSAFLYCLTVITTIGRLIHFIANKLFLLFTTKCSWLYTSKSNAIVTVNTRTHIASLTSLLI